jgi:hypothetical protein
MHSQTSFGKAQARTGIAKRRRRYGSRSGWWGYLTAGNKAPAEIETAALALLRRQLIRDGRWLDDGVPPCP